MDENPGAVDMAGDDPNEANKIKSEGLKFVFNANRDIFPHNPCPYHEDGNPEMYSKESMEKRRQLRDDVVVKEAINTFMLEFSTTNSGACSKEEYFKVFHKIGSILRPGIEADELQRIIKEDFEMDSLDKAPVTGDEDPARAEQL